MIVRATAIALIGSITIGCDDLFGRHFHWFQKLTVIVDTPSGPKSGIAVIEVDAEFYRKGTYIGNAAKVNISGEAGVIEVSPGKYLFVLLKGFNQSTAFSTLIPKSPPAEKSATAESARFAAMQTFETTITTTPLPLSLYPVFVTFRDIADPATLVVVDPRKLAGEFGTGVELGSVVLTVSPQEAIADKVQRILPWIEAVGKQRGSVVPTKKQFESELTSAEKIRPSDFITIDRWRRD
jgi:hypothetical protein